MSGIGDSKDPLLSQVADAEINLRTLVLGFPQYIRQFLRMLRAPRRHFGELNYAARNSTKNGLAFMLQGITLGFVLLTMGWAAPQSIAHFLATPTPILTPGRAELAEYARRIQELKGVLPPSLAKQWTAHGELMLIVRVLPADRFDVMLDRLRELSEKERDVLEEAIAGTPFGGDRPGGRGYVLGFFLALDPRMVALRHLVPLESVRADSGARLRPHVDFLLRNIILWYLTCYVISRFLSARSGSKDTGAVFVIGAYLVGFLGPLFQAFLTLMNIYSAATLPYFIHTASALLGGVETSGLGRLSSGIFPYENLLLVVANVGARVAVVGMALDAFVNGTLIAYRVPKERAWMAACVGLGISLGAIEMLSGLITGLLAATGLL